MLPEKKKIEHEMEKDYLGKKTCKQTFTFQKLLRKWLKSCVHLDSQDCVLERMCFMSEYQTRATAD